MSTVAVAGAAGFVGSALVERLRARHQVVALTRGNPDSRPSAERLSWRRCDLFSQRETERALQGCDTAIYLVHSMLPAAHLTQGRFEDLDLLVADNFVRAAATVGVRHIVYLGGIIPDGVELSKHLLSRLEVERVLRSQGVPVTALRAAMIFGRGGSSMNIMARLVKRLPIMVCPAWTATRSRPIYIGDVLAALEHCIETPETWGREYDIGGDTLVTYREMMEQLGSYLGRKPRAVSVPLLSPKISRLWVSVFSGAPKNLIAPLIETLRHDMVPRADRALQIPGHRYLSFSEMLELCFKPEASGRAVEQPRAFSLPDDERLRTTVRSVQRLHLPPGMSAPDVAELYVDWLSKHLRPFIRAVATRQLDRGHRICEFSLTGLPWKLLVLEMREERGTVDSAEFIIRSGMLVKGDGRKGEGGRFEFRLFPEQQSLIAAIHDFHPRLPWFVYIWTQAKIHLYVMRAFDRYLRSRVALGSGQVRG